MKKRIIPYQLSDLSWNLKLSETIFQTLFCDVSMKFWWNAFRGLFGNCTVPNVLTIIVICPENNSPEKIKSWAIVELNSVVEYTINRLSMTWIQVYKTFFMLNSI